MAEPPGKPFINNNSHLPESLVVMVRICWLGVSTQGLILPPSSPPRSPSANRPCQELLHSFPVPCCCRRQINRSRPEAEGRDTRQLLSSGQKRWPGVGGVLSRPADPEGLLHLPASPAPAEAGRQSGSLFAEVKGAGRACDRLPS